MNENLPVLSPPALRPAPRARPAAAARGTILAAATLTIMAASVISPSLPAMAEVFARTPGADVLVRLTLTITSLAIAITAPVSGVLADRIGRRPLLLGALTLYAASGAAGALLADLGGLLATRALLGVAVGGIMTAVSATITDWFTGPDRARFLGLQQAAASLGGIVFLPVAGALAGFSWRAPFWIYAVSLLVLPFVALTLREPPRSVAPGPTSSPPSGPAQAVGDTTAVARVGATRRIAGIYALALIVTLAFYMVPTQLPFSLRTVGASPVLIGFVIAAVTLTSAVGAVMFPPLRRRLRPDMITALSVGLLGIGWTCVGAFDALPLITIGVLIGGLGVGFAVPHLNLQLSELAAPERRGRVLGGLVASIFLGQFISPLVVQPLVDYWSIPAAFTVAGIAMTVGGVLLAVVPRTDRASAR